MKTRIHVDQHVIRRNAKEGTNDPPISVKTYKGTTKCHGVSIDGPSMVMYSPERPLSCGARVWVETHAEVLMHFDS